MALPKIIRQVVIILKLFTMLGELTEENFDCLVHLAVTAMTVELEVPFNLESGEMLVCFSVGK